MATQLSSVNPTLLPPTIVGPIFAKAAEASAVQQLARKIPLAVNAATAIPVPMDVPAADWVAEGGSKVVASEAVGTKIMTGKKLALLVPVSQEVAMTNPGGLYDQLQQDLPTAMARAFDYAAIHGLSLRSGSAGPFSDYLAVTGNSIELGTASQATGSTYKDLVDGEALVLNANYDFSGFAADPRLRPVLKKSTTTQGEPLWVSDPSMGLNGGNLIGYPAYYNRGVSGNYRRQGNKVQLATVNGTPTGGTFTLSVQGQTTAAIAYNAAASAVQAALRLLGGNLAAVTVSGSAGGPYTITFPTTGMQLTGNGAALTGGSGMSVTVAQSGYPDSRALRAIGGDWSQAAWGQGMDITIKVSTEASYVDEAAVTHSAFQENLVLLLVEAYYGFVMGDPNAFVCYTDAS